MLENSDKIPLDFPDFPGSLEEVSPLGSGKAEANQLHQLGALIWGNGSPLIRIWSKSKGQLCKYELSP